MFRMLYIRRSTAAHSSHRLVFWDWPKNTLHKKQHDAAQQQLTSARSASPDRLPSVSIRPFGHSTINRLHPFPRCAGNCFFSLLRDDRPVVALRNTRRLSIPIALTIHTLAVPGPLLATLPPLWFTSPPNPQTPLSPSLHRVFSFSSCSSSSSSTSLRETLTCCFWFCCATALSHPRVLLQAEQIISYRPIRPKKTPGSLLEPQRSPNQITLHLFTQAFRPGIFPSSTAQFETPNEQVNRPTGLLSTIRTAPLYHGITRDRRLWE